MSRFLIVDDDADIRLLLRLALGAEGHDITEAEHGGAAIACLDTDPPDLVLLDLMMPVVDGWEVLRSMGSREDGPGVVAITALASHDQRHLVEVLEAGAVDVVAKPFDIEWLVELVGQLATADATERAAHRAGRLAAARGER
ncbi:MAG: response regulator [Actinomycetota bacterium]|nr:response regulator [Actinomycetota bacterium]